MIGNGNNEELDVNFVKIQGLKSGSTEVYFEVKKSETDADGKKSYVVLEGKPTRIAGQLVKIEQEEREFKEDTIRSLKLHLRDGDQLIILSLNLNGICRSFVNGLATQEDLNGWYEFSVYLNRSNGRPNLYVLHDKEKMEWKWDYSVFAEKIKEVKVGKKTTVVYDELNDWLWEEILPPIVEGFKPEHYESDKTDSREVLVDSQELEPDDDLPF